MKLIIITAIQEFEQHVKQIFKTAGIKAFTYKSVTGYRDDSLNAIDSNWFATEFNENESILFFAFVHEKVLNETIELIQLFNKQQETLSRIHFATLNIEQSN
jgi:hypothetical protein